jgi:hypothetical protein
MTLGQIRMGDLKTDIQILFQNTNVSDTNVVVDLSTCSAIKITIIDPDGFIIINEADMSIVNSPGTDGLAHYLTNATTSLWNKPGRWRWFGTWTTAAGTFSTNDASREILE